MTSLKIYILPVEEEFMPRNHIQYYPIHNKRFYGVEQDFLDYLNVNSELLTNNPKEADWHYLPIFWNNFYGLRDHSLDDVPEVQSQIDSAVIDDNKTFTVCEYAPGTHVETGRMILFSVSWKSEKDINIPLLCDKHQVLTIPKKKFLASFVGLIWTHEIRSSLRNYYIKNDSIKIVKSNKNTQLFIDTMLESYIALCPRGTGTGSYRFYEAMQLGVVPFLVGDIDVRPFKKYIDWDSISFFSNTVEGVDKILNEYTNRLEELLEKGCRAKQVFENELYYQKWCKYALRELENLIK